MVLSTLLQNLLVLFPTSELHSPSYSLQNHVALFLSLRTIWSSFLSPSGLRGPLLSLFTSSEPHGPLPIYLLQNCVVSPFLLASEPHGSLFTSPKLSDPLPPPPKPCGPLFPFIRTAWTSIYLLASEPRGSPIYFRATWSTPLYGCWA